MSNITTNPEVENIQPEFPQNARKSVTAIIFSIVLIALSAASIFVSSIGNEMLYKFLFAFDFITEGPAPAVMRFFTAYAYFATAIFALVFAIVALAKNSNTLPVFSKGYGILACGALVFTLSFEFEVGSLLLAIVTLIIGSIAAFKEKGKTATIYVLQAVLTVAAFALVAIGLGKAVDTEAGILLIVGLALMTISVAIACLRLDAKGVAFEFVRAICTLIGTAIALANGAGLYAVIAVVIAIIQIVITILQIRARNKAAIEEAKEEVENTFYIEEYAEAFTYEGGPVAGVRMAEEVTPTAKEAPVSAYTAGYDFYNSKAFDPFIATLDDEERKQFTELFILKHKGVMPEIPEYEVGGDNSEFFRKVFIYLGQYRDRFPNSLLIKIYQYTLKFSN